MATTERVPFSTATAKFTIGSIDDPNLTVSAQYNPKEVSISQAVAWTPDDKKGPGDQGLHYQSGARNPRKYTVDLVFDGVERPNGDGDQGYLRGTPATVGGQIEKLRTLIERIPNRPKYQDDRPHFCVALWGKGGIPAMSCVIDNLTIKYEMFDEAGKVIRATVTVSILEAWRVDKSREAPVVKQQAYLDIHPPAAVAASSGGGSAASKAAPPARPAPAAPAKAETPAQADARRRLTLAQKNVE